MQVLGKFVHSLTFSNEKSFIWPLVVVKNLTADLMKEAGAITDHSTNPVYFRNNNSDIPIKFEGCSRMPLEAAGQIQKVMHNPTVRLNTDVHLKAGCRRIIRIEPIEARKFSSNKFAVFEPNESYFNNHSVAALPSTQRVDSDMKLHLLVANLSNDPIKMPQGTKVGTVHYTNCISTLKPLKVESTANPVLHAVSCSVVKRCQVISNLLLTLNLILLISQIYNLQC